MRVKFPRKDVNGVVRALSQGIREEDYPVKATVSVQGNRLLVKVSKMGTSTLYFGVEVRGGGTNLTFQGKDVATFHKPFISDVEDMIEELVERCGGECL